ncbi:subtype B tannase [Actinobacillus vicugnae]|uniref:subtype B tannase n=1 Tax=Actinobacillus vicugnae TaxID=2573093 RepID=UPI00123FCC9A|nr:subtype B tannase [Actinobacillus vicugnae]
MNQAFAQSTDKPVEPAFANQLENGFDLNFNDKNYRTVEALVNGLEIKYRAFENIVYVQNPVEPDYQTLNFYVPEAYFNGGEINGYNVENAPIFLPNSVGGYMPAKAKSPDTRPTGVKPIGNPTKKPAGIPEFPADDPTGEKVQVPARGNKPDTILVALSKGYVVASVGARGRTLGTEGNYTGKAPAAIIDLKSAVRYLHANNTKMAGDANKIIANGTSAGGALSSLLGASANHADYAKYFKALGAAEASDAIFAVSAYCPIINLENADSAYEWEFNGVNEYSRMDMSKLNAQSYNDRAKGMLPKIEGSLSEQEIKLSEQLKAHFPAYLNSLNLTDEQGNRLTLDEKGNGSFKTYLTNIIATAADKAVQQGADLSKTTWVKMENSKVVGIDWDGYVKSDKRMKSPPAFDSLDLSSGENNLFGDKLVNNKHFTKFSLDRSRVANAQLADAEIVKVMNPMNYVENSVAAQHWRIRVGTADRDTSHAVSAIFATKLKMVGKNVDYATPWAVPHSGDYDLDELFQWVDSIVKPTK